MALNRMKYRRVTDLYVRGRELTLRDGTIMWVQVLNSFEVEAAREDGRGARARMVMALQEHGSDELAKVEASFFVIGRERIIEQLVDAKYPESLVRANETIANDPDWTERLAISARQDEILSREPSDPERQLLDKINQDYLVESGQLIDEALEDHRKKFEAMSDVEVRDAFVKLYIDQRGAGVALAEHRLSEVFFAARCCDGTQSTDGIWDHSSCDNHHVQVFENRREVRDAPDDLIEEIHAALSQLNMTPRDAKNSDRPQSSSASSLPSNEEEASTASGPDVIPVADPGTSASPSPTP
jgi:hypothetical protein